MTTVSGDLFAELWVSLASLLRSYTAAHGLNGDRQATVELGEERIRVRHGDRWLDLERSADRVRWLRENGNSGVLALTEAGRLRSSDPSAHEEVEMDMAAEQWARELML
ncbi:MAG: transcriptional regulator [Terracidiphilus sp.]